MNVPFCDLRRLYTEQKSQIDDAIRGVLDRGHYILGPECQSFETEMAQTLGDGVVVSCNSGTDALILSLKLADVGAGDEVACPSMTAIPTITAINAVGARPLFVDIDPNTWLMDARDLAQIKSSRTKAIIAVHLYGNPLDVASLQSSNGCLVVEDVAQAMGATVRERPAGSMGFCGAFSFYPTKNIGALGDGGAVYCADEAVGSRGRMLRNYGQVSRYRAQIQGGLNTRLDELQAAVLRTRLSKLQEWNAVRARKMAQYREAFAGLPVRFQACTAEAIAAWHLCVISTESQTVRDALKEHLDARSVQTLIHYPVPNHLQPAFSAFATRPLPTTENLANSILSLPMYSALRDDEQSYVVDSVRSFFA